MADILSALDSCDFEISDGAASAGVFTAIVPVGLPDRTDVTGVPMVKAGAIVGLVGASAPVSGDTVILRVYKNGTAIDPSGASDVTLTNTAPVGEILFGKDATLNSVANANHFNAGDLIEVFYETTTGGSYTAHDIFARVVVQYGLSE
jgi:hypothetical protein